MQPLSLHESLLRKGALTTPAMAAGPGGSPYAGSAARFHCATGLPHGFAVRGFSRGSCSEGGGGALDVQVLYVQYDMAVTVHHLSFESWGHMCGMCPLTRRYLKECCHGERVAARGCNSGEIVLRRGSESDCGGSGGGTDAPGRN